jgi:DNA-binding response OmpR family regulator
LTSIDRERQSVSMAVNDKIKVLIVEDEEEIRALIEDHFQEAGMQTLSLENGEKIMTAIETFSPQIILLDNIMPGKTGKELIAEIRSHSQWSEIPIMMITGLNSEADKIAALDIGADDYITKPFSLKEAVARANALVRRRWQSHKSQIKNLVFGPIEIDLKAHKVVRGGLEIPFTLTEFRILTELVKQVGQVITRDRLRERALGNLNVSDRTIDVHMASVRKKLDGLGDNIETVRGVGYRLTPQT